MAEVAFKAGPQSVHKYTRLARFCINLFLVLDLVGCCCVYIVFVSTNIKQVVDYYSENDINIRLYMLMLLPFLIPVNLIRN
ncbi:hypothetical protein, partial [Klebsiella pneumoniae]|uniref:hypothetical protein n=1 Tax=Klebsiella pneumoniae TaxID=573 RepID=UPI0034D97CF9